MTRALLTSAILLVSVTASAQQDVFIQDDGTGQQDQQYQQPQDQQYQDQNQQYQPQAAQPQAAQQPAAVERGARQTGLYLTVPLFLTNPVDAADNSRTWDPGFGIGIGGRFGWEFGMLVPEIHIGVQTNLSNADFVGEDGPISRITAFHFSLGARLQFLNPSRFLPFVAVAFRGNFWGYTAEDGGGSIEYDFNPAASGTVGLAVELSETIGLEAAVDVVANFGLAATTESVIEGTDLMLIPRLGGTLYF